MKIMWATRLNVQSFRNASYCHTSCRKELAAFVGCLVEWTFESDREATETLPEHQLRCFPLVTESLNWSGRAPPVCIHPMRLNPLPKNSHTKKPTNHLITYRQFHNFQLIVKTPMKPNSNFRMLHLHHRTEWNAANWPSTVVYKPSLAPTAATQCAANVEQTKAKQTANCIGDAFCRVVVVQVRR